MTGDDWELFTHGMDCREAAQSLTEALEKAIEGCASGEMTAYEAMDRHFYPVAQKYADYGACDSEPTSKAESVLARIHDMTKGRKTW